MRPDPVFSVVPVILAGGEGRRLRPLTGPARPKPFLKILKGRSLLQLALARGSAFNSPLIVCDARFAPAVSLEAQGIGVTNFNILAEPVQRGTAAAIACAAFLLQKNNPLMLVMPSDHVISNQKIFCSTVEKAAALADQGPVILGKIPETGSERYGYMRTRPGESGVFVLDSFIEKPPRKVARALAKTPGVFWNTGIFLCRARMMLELMARHAPDVFEAAGHAMATAARQADIVYPAAGRYAAVPSLSIDHALMESLQEATVLPLETGWHDVGCWERLLAVKLGSITRAIDFPLQHDTGRKREKYS